MLTVSVSTLRSAINALPAFRFHHLVPELRMTKNWRVNLYNHVWNANIFTVIGIFSQHLLKNMNLINLPVIFQEIRLLFQETCRNTWLQVMHMILCNHTQQRRHRLLQRMIVERVHDRTQSEDWTIYSDVAFSLRVSSKLQHHAKILTDLSAWHKPQQRWSISIHLNFSVSFHSYSQQCRWRLLRFRIVMSWCSTHHPNRFAG